MKKFQTLLIVLILVLSCKENIEKKETRSKKKTKIKETQKILSEDAYVLNENFLKGDVRRYGVFPDSAYANTHPVSKKSKITTVLDMAEANNIELFFPKGFYKTALILNSRKEIKIRFDSSEFDLLQIAKKSLNDQSPSNIELMGSLILYDKLSIGDAINISIDSLYIKTNIKKNLRKMRPRGGQITRASENITICYLEIEDLGSGNHQYKSNHAGLVIDGWKSTPKNVNIGKIYIKSSDRHGLYMMGSNHSIKEIVIDKFGIGSHKNMNKLQGTSSIEYKVIAGIWINKCYHSTIGDITINAKNSEGYFTTNFDEGDSLKPVKIRQLTIKNFDRTLPIRFAKNTGVIVEKTIKE